MKAPLRITVVLVVAALMVCVGGDRAGGFSYFSYGGYTVIWYGGQALRYLSPGTFPEGSEPDTLILASMGQWSTVWGGGFEFFYVRLTEDPVVDHYDGYSDTAAVPASYLDPGVLGVTYMVNSADAWYDMDLFFSDFPENVGWHMLTNPDCEITANPTPDNGFSFYLVALHELGHCLGLGHDPIGDEPPGTPWFPITMNPAYPAGGPIGSNNIIELHTDDRRGLRFLYPGTSESRIDLGNDGYCSQGPRIGKVVPVFVDPPVITAGEVLTAWSVIENLGTATVNDVHQGFYLSTDDVVDTGDLLLGETRWDIPAADGYEFSAEIDMPDLAPGTYYFGTMLDDLNEIAEEYEDNNDIVYCDPLVIEQAAPTFEPFSQQVITCDEPYVGPTPQVPYPISMAPITWSIANPQPGMTIDPATGQLNWPNPIKSPFVYEIDIRATNDAGTSKQTLSLGVQQAPPVIVTIPNQTTKCGLNYTGPTPVLTAPTCMESILSWTLISGPPGMIINSGSGVVYWPDAVPSSSPYVIKIRAINAVGEGTETWLLFVGPSDGDLDADGDVDVLDFAALEPCLDGPNAGLAPGCRCTDLDGDNDVDLRDFARLTANFTGTIIREGACCHGDGYCGDGSPEDCAALGGTYLGDGTTCAETDCNGACCFFTGGCLGFSSDNCDVAGGTFQGFGTDCAELTCPPGGQGACCMSSESCAIKSYGACVSSNGLYQGTGMSCEVTDCTTPVGACCHGDGTCSEGTDGDCAASGGAYMGDDTPCTAVTCLGACCYPSGGCLDLGAPDCAVTGGTFQGAGTNCGTADCPIEPVGACCMPDETCLEETASVCGSFGGSYQGDDTECASVDCTAAAIGACCMADESCDEVTTAACELAGGTFIGQATTCAATDCSLTEVGACYDPADWSCTETSPTICAALGGIFEGIDSDCASTSAPEYQNEVAVIDVFYLPGANKAMADDMTLSGTGRGLVSYDLAVYGTGGGTFDVTVSLYDDCPGEGGVLIADTQSTWNDVPADDSVYIVSADLSDNPVRIPDTMWMVATFSSANAGWVLAGPAEIGTTADVYAENDPPWVCDYWFGGPPNDYAGFWATIECVDLPEPEGACCYADESCAVATISACDAAGGLFMGDATTCGEVDCTGLNIGACCNVLDWTCSITTAEDCATAGGSYDGNGTSCSSGACPEYGNDIDPIMLSYNPGQPMADDLSLAGTERELSYFEIAVYGGGGGDFDVSTALYDGSPCAGGTQIPGTLVTGTGLPDNGQVLNLNVTFASPITLPNDPWLVVEFSNAYAGWIVAEEAESGYTADQFGLATYNPDTDDFDWTCDNQINDPPNVAYAGFWTHLQCIAPGAKAMPTGAARPFMTVTPMGDLGGEVASLKRASPRSGAAFKPLLFGRQAAPASNASAGAAQAKRQHRLDAGRQLSRVPGKQRRG